MFQFLRSLGGRRRLQPGRAEQSTDNAALQVIDMIVCIFRFIMVPAGTGNRFRMSPTLFASTMKHFA